MGKRRKQKMSAGDTHTDRSFAARNLSFLRLKQGDNQKHGVKQSEEEYRRSYSFLASCLGFVGFGLTVVALYSIRWSVFDAPLQHEPVSGKLGLYYYELRSGNFSTNKTWSGAGEVVKGR